MNKKLILIGLALATTLGVGFFLYKKSSPAPQDEELVMTSSPQSMPEPEEPIPAETASPAPESALPESSPEPATQAQVKARSGHFELSRPSSMHEVADAQDHPGFGKAREDRLWEIFKSDKDLARSIQVNRIQCRVDTCIVEAESKDGDADRFQSLMFALTRQYPWIGNKIDVTTPDGDPLKGRFVYFQEIPK
jgi:hypothetical protein